LTKSEGRKQLIGEGPAYIQTVKSIGQFGVLYCNPD